MSTFAKSAALLLAVAVALAPGATAASCPKVDVVQDFNLDAYLGAWHEVAVSALARYTFERNCVCTTAHYNTTADPATVSVINTCNANTPAGKLSKAVGSAKTDAAEPAKLQVSFGGPYAPYWVINADPKLQQYAVVWSCSEFLGVRAQILWVLSRTPQLEPELVQNLLADAQNRTGFDTSSMHMTEQGGQCQY